MRIDELVPSFPAAVRRRGLEDRRADKVTVREGSATAIRALVSGVGRYEVCIAVEGRTLVLSCSCPAFESDGPCKHLWATALVAADGGLLATMSSSWAKVRLEMGQLAPDDWDDDLDDDGSTVEGRFQLTARQPPDVRAPLVARTPDGSPSARPFAPAWEALFHDRSVPARAQPPGWLPSGDLMYVVEAHRTRELGELTIALRTRTARKKGGFAKDKPASLPLAALELLSDERDRRALPLLQAAAVLSGRERASYPTYHPGYGFVPRFASEAQITVSVGRELLPLLAQTGRLFVRRALQAEPVPAAYQGDPPWDFVLGLSPTAAGTGFDIVGRFERSGESRPVSEPLVVTNSGWIVFHDQIAHLRHFDAYAMLASLRGTDKLTLAAADQGAFLSRLYAHATLPRLALPEALALEEIDAHATPHLKLQAGARDARRRRDAEADWLTAELSFVYHGFTIAADDQRQVIPHVSERRLIRRDRSGEAAAVIKLVEAGFRDGREYWQDRAAPVRYGIPRVRLAGAVRALLEAGWRVEAEGKPYRQAGRFDLSVTSGVDWFDLQAQIDFDGVSIALPDLLRALRRGDGLVVLGDGSLGMLPEQWLKKYAALAEMGAVEGDRLRFRPAQAGLLDALLASQPEVAVDAVFAKARERLREFASVTPTRAPPGFRGQLRPYQEAGLGWLSFLREFGFGGCLADDMGLGKTIQVLAMLAGRPRRRGHPSIVVVPKSLVWNWQHEAARFTPDLRILVHTGPERASTATLLKKQLARSDVLLTTYGLMRKDAAFLREVEADYVILDEAQTIKNASSESAKAARLLRGEHRLALSGTPVENHLGELWSLIEFLNPGLLGSARAFAAASVKRPEPETLSALARAVRPFLLRRTKEEVAPELPGKHEETILCEMEPEQRRLYDELREHYRASLLGRIAEKGLGQAKIQVLEALLRLRQAACHPGLVDPQRRAAGSGKLDVLLARLEEVRREGHKALVFSQFTSFLALVRERLDAGKVPYAYLDGDTVDRQACVARFQTDPACPLFLLSLKAGGVGLNLTAADYVFILDPWWNPAVEAQAVDRAHRIGQAKRVFVYRLLCRDSVEEKVAALQETKRDLAASIISADGTLMQNLDRETLELLLA